MENSEYIKVGDMGVITDIKNGSSFSIRLTINGEKDYGVKEEKNSINKGE